MIKLKLPNNIPFVSRLAPTPSGFLHVGNILNFCLTAAIVKKSKGILILRIDDMDASRERREYVEDIFDSLEWLNIHWDQGPKDTDDFYNNFSQQSKTSFYREKLSLFNIDTLYHCKCSRKEIRIESPSGLYSGKCRSLDLEFKKGLTATRIKTDSNLITIEEHDIDINDHMKDFVIWRKDDLPSYQLVSLMEDIENKVNLIVRGKDLFPSSAAQVFLSKFFQNNFENTKFIHHDLILDDKEKLSKSEGALSIKELRSKGASPSEVYNKVGQFLGQENINSLNDLISRIEFENN